MLTNTIKGKIKKANYLKLAFLTINNSVSTKTI
ncbi:hypothetical protein SAMN06265219_11531 [Gracilimonas mengyeensis]|uniref:Uncharacterized protein n=1 Tax=Gracilimonas mengyeensis TaxID=1302730 RepID=A0A521F4G8_9BACT|nr:hypothetical protein SAMN06265219_11531 [Gracilimonas mengyeensis]